jgi:trehalose 6-phosphate phosphatase
VASSSLLAPFAGAPDRSAVILDVDGVLAPIVARPDLARVPDETKAELVRLVGRYRLVACLSGRSGDDARRLVGTDGVRIVGNHGLELEPHARSYAGAIAAFRDETGRPVEDKGLSLSYHFREAANEPAAIAELEEIADRAAAAGLAPRWGRKVLEIRPPVAADKGTAVRALLGECGASRALYAGDDATDLDAFAGLRTAGLEHALRIAVASAEGPPELAAEADLVVNGPEAVLELLREL